MKITEHARKRWMERFRPDEGFEDCLRRSAPVSWKQLRAEAKRARLRFRLRSANSFLRDAESGAVFVIAGDQIVTVIRQSLAPILPPIRDLSRAEEPKKWRRRRHESL